MVRNHSSCPVAQARMDVLGPEGHPDFSGPGIQEARKMIVLLAEAHPEEDQPDEMSPLDTLSRIAEDLSMMGLPAELVTQMTDAIEALRAEPSGGPTSDQPDLGEDGRPKGSPVE